MRINYYVRLKLHYLFTVPKKYLSMEH